MQSGQDVLGRSPEGISTTLWEQAQEIELVLLGFAHKVAGVADSPPREVFPVPHFLLDTGGTDFVNWPT
jgi:hypothetical protein